MKQVVEFMRMESRKKEAECQIKIEALERRVGERSKEMEAIERKFARF